MFLATHRTDLAHQLRPLWSLLIQYHAKGCKIIYKHCINNFQVCHTSINKLHVKLTNRNIAFWWFLLPQNPLVKIHGWQFFQGRPLRWLSPRRGVSWLGMTSRPSLSHGRQSWGNPGGDSWWLHPADTPPPPPASVFLAHPASRPAQCCRLRCHVVLSQNTKWENG